MKQAEEHFASAAAQLQLAVPEEISRRLGTIRMPTFDSHTSVGDKARELSAVLDEFLESRKELAKDYNRKNKVENILLGCFKACYPFASLFLSVAKDAAQVCFLQRKYANLI